MRNVKVVIGANFGDEGKGLMTDYFCSRFPKDKKVLNVRFNGGAQAGHTVVTPEGKRHVFGHFGAGSFLPNVATYLGPEFIVNPILFRREYEKLCSKGIYPMVYCHPRCIFTMPQDMMVNQFIEKERGSNRHGSCGVGIYETILRNTHLKIDVQDAYCLDGMNTDLNYYDAERFEQILNMKMDDHTKELMSNQNIMAHFREDLQFMLGHINIIDEKIFCEFDNVVFEGAQGLMLDQNNMDYFPHLTPSNTGIANITPYLHENMNMEICYVTRPYLTRHGAGILPGECTREEAGAKVDITNLDNEWQGSLRYGKLDLKDFMDRCMKDIAKHLPVNLNKSNNLAISAAMTHLDEFATKDNPSPGVDEVMSIHGENEYYFYEPFDNNYMSHGPRRDCVTSLIVKNLDSEWRKF